VFRQDYIAPALAANSTVTGPNFAAATLASLNNAQVFSAPQTLTGVTLNTNVLQGTALKHGRVTTGSIGAGLSAAVTLTWGGSAFADTNYTPNCSVIEATASTVTLRVHHIESVTTTTIVVRIVNDDGAAAKTGTLACTAEHD